MRLVRGFPVAQQLPLLHAAIRDDDVAAGIAGSTFIPCLTRLIPCPVCVGGTLRVCSRVFEVWVSLSGGDLVNPAALLSGVRCDVVA